MNNSVGSVMEIVSEKFVNKNDGEVSDFYSDFSE